eukprot:10456967-Karenia_brevis.AAC.2
MAAAAKASEEESWRALEDDVKKKACELVEEFGDDEISNEIGMLHVKRMKYVHSYMHQACAQQALDD